MSNYQFANNATTTIGSSVSSGATTITVATGQGALFPSPTGGQYFTATIFSAGSSTGTPNEIVKVTARTGDTMTVVRAQEGTAATSWNVGDTFANYPTAAFLNAIPLTTDVASVVQAQAGNYAVDSGIANAGVVTLSPAPASLAALVGVPIRVLKMGSANTGAYTLNVNGLGAEGVFVGGNALISGQLPASQIFEVMWDGAEFELLSVPGVIANSGLAQIFDKGSTSNGYWEKNLITGFIRQWGHNSTTIVGEVFVTQNFPIPFTDINSIVINAMPNNPSGNTNANCFFQGGSVALSSATMFLQVVNDGGSPSPPSGFSWSAVGY